MSRTSSIKTKTSRTLTYLLTREKSAHNMWTTFPRHLFTNEGSKQSEQNGIPSNSWECIVHSTTRLAAPRKSERDPATGPGPQ
eukprot:scaffold84637_cov35-Tisochrysis_lutea.AAC.1